MKRTIIDEYLDYQLKYQSIYGENTIIFMEVGSFYELYSVENKDENIGKVKEIAEILNIQITKKNKSIKEVSRKNPYLAGIPTVSFKRYLDIILKLNKYTVVLVEQVTEPPTPKREVTEILSPGTCITDNQNDSNNLLSIFIQEEYGNNYSIGCSVIDVSTGKNILFETYSSKNDNMLAFSEAENFITSNHPKEIIINTNNLNIENTELIFKLNISNIVYHIENNVDKDLLKLNYQEKFLSNIFENDTMLSTIEFLDLEKKKLALNSYILLLKFSYEHNKNIINKIQKPIIWIDKKHLKLANNAIYQLNLISKFNDSNSSINSLFDLLNNTSTSLGRRLFKFKLLNPILDVDILNMQYKNIELMRKNYKEYEKHLDKIYDIERLHRKISLKKLNPAEFTLLDYSYNSISEIINMSNDDFNDFKLSDNDKNNFNDFKNDYKSKFDIDEMSKFNFHDINKNFFKVGIHKEIDEIQNKISELINILNFIVHSLNKIVYNNEKSNQKSNLFKLEKTEKDGYYIYITNSRYKEFNKKQNNNIIDITINDKIKYFLNNFKLNTKVDFTIEELTIKNLTNNKKITSELFDEISNFITLLTFKLSKKVKDKYIYELDYFSKKYHLLFDSISNYISNIDVVKSNAKNSLIYNYTKPIINNTPKNSFIKAKDLRHPVIEIIENDIQYIPNDVNLDDESEMNGMLLYGVNASGKSIYMKSIGVGIIMAQSGMYVPSSHFEYKPFKKLYTRISGEDNMLKGLSSFAVEMTELRNILRNNDENTLVLGDEISHGTETTSGLAIVSSAIIELSQKNTKLVFATHLHELSNMQEINKLKKVKHYHLKVEYDEKEQILIYNRKLKKGSGEPIYGLEVAKAMDLDKNFIKRAYKIRENIVNNKNKKEIDILTNQKIKKSNYNKSVIMTKCYFCDNDAVHSHHIIEQHQSDENNFVLHFHKNRKFNILPVCEKHHKEIHDGKIFINGFVKTSKGIKLDFEKK